jgi:DNA-binding NtrC family response regulator
MARLLLVDDEAALLDLLRRYLERLGHQVVACDGAEAALVEFSREPMAYELVLSDLTLPDLPGDAMLERMYGMNPALRAILTSGYPYVPRAAYISFLQKPFAPRMLAETIESLLGVPRPDSPSHA